MISWQCGQPSPWDFMGSCSLVNLPQTTTATISQAGIYLLLKDTVLKAGHCSVTIKGSKTDQERRSARILVGTTGTSTCPVQAMWAFLRSAKHPRSTPPLYPVFWTVPYTHQAHNPPTLTARGHQPHTQAGWPLQQPQPEDWCGNRSSSRGAAHLADPEGWTLAK